MIMIFAFCGMTILFLIACSFCQRFIKTIREQRNTLQAIVTECHGIIGACFDDSGQVVEQEASLTAILTECHATLGNDVSSCFDSLDLSERQYYAKHPYPVNRLASWSELSALQVKQAVEKKIRKAENEPGFGKFTIDDEPFEPDAVVMITKPRISTTVNDINGDTPTKPFI